MGVTTGRSSDPLLSRPDLFRSAARSRVCVVIGAAGWGKSAAVGSWPAPKAWVPFECHGGDTAAFAASLLAALASQLPDPLPELPSAASPGFASAVCAWLGPTLREDLVLVVDDVHELPAGGGAARIVEGLCRHAPDRLHVVLVSRREPPFSLTRLRGQGKVVDIDAPELAFGVDEVAELLHWSIGEAPPELARQVWERTSGWPTAVWNAVGMLRGVPENERTAVLDRMVHPGERFHGYLLEQVVGPEPDRVRQLLRWLAVFGPVTASSGTATGITEAPVLLPDLARRGLVRRLPGRPDRWALVGPLRDYFEQEPVLPASERAALHRTAASEFASRGAFGSALRHAVAAGDDEVCCELLLRHGDQLVSAGQIDAVLAAADLVAECLDDPRIQRVLGRARQARGEWARAMECFGRANDTTAGADELDPALAWRVAALAYMHGDFAEVLSIPGRLRPAASAAAGRDAKAAGAKAADAKVADAEVRGSKAAEMKAVDADEARLLALVAITRRMVGDYGGARADTERAVAAARRSGEPSAMAAARAALSGLATAAGDRRRAEAYCVSALEAAEHSEDALLVVRVRIQRAATLCELGLLRDALTEAGVAVGEAERFEEVFLTAHALHARGAVQCRLGDLDAALEDFTASRDAFQRLGSRFLAWPLCGLGDVYRLRGQLARARAAYEEALTLAEPQHEVLGLGAALCGLARVRAADDFAAARELAERAVALGEGMRAVQALLTRGWVALSAGDREAAAADAGLASAAARSRRDDPGLAEALVLASLCSPDPAWRDRSITEAIQIWRDTGCRIQEAVAVLVASRAGVVAAALDGEFAVETLRERGVDLRAPRPAGPLGVLAGVGSWVSIRALGVFRVVRDGVPVPRTEWRSRKARQLLKIMVAKRRPVTREQLMELLWPEADPDRAGNRLSVLLSALRDVLQAGGGTIDTGPLVTDGSVVWLDLTMVDVDVERFLSHATAALEAHRQGHPDALARLVAAEAAHTGEFLEDDPYQEWARPLAEEVRATHVTLLRALVQRHRQLGEVDEVVRYSLRLLDKDRYEEQAHLDLVQVLLDAGRHGEARRRYDLYAQAMVELGVEPRPFGARYSATR
jgi:ATP/maltotriose-dependent transcriptional regulator MalT/DNA-binding SARP family transcriptional activator